MSGSLAIDYALRTEQGDKPENADAVGLSRYEGMGLLHKGVAAAIADGMSSSEGGKEASEVCVTGFLNDYFSTPDSWTVRTSAANVLGALNRWLFAQGQTRFGTARGMVTTFSGLVIKSTTAHVLHVGDSRIYQCREGQLEQLTRDHRVWLSNEREFLSRAMGVDPHVDIDYRSCAVEIGDLFLFVTDGVSGHITDHQLGKLLLEHLDNLQAGVNAIVEEALRNGSQDNVSCLLIRVLNLPSRNEDDILQEITDLPFPPDLAPGMTLDGLRILREMHASKRSEVFLVEHTDTGRKAILKTPSVNYRDDPAYIEGFLHEEWVGRRIDNAHVLKFPEFKGRRFLYHLAEYVEGQSLRQWLSDHRQTHINKARDFLTQIAEGLRAFHRLEMTHLDLKPENILIDKNGTLKIIDFGSTRVAGSVEIETSFADDAVQGTVNYSAPECGDGHCSNRADIFSLGVMAYELLTGALPFGEQDRPLPANRLCYRSCRDHNPDLAPWVDGALRKATHPDFNKRYDSLSEFLYDLNHPNPAFEAHSTPLIERDPLRFWQVVAGISLLGNIFLLLLG